MRAMHVSRLFQGRLWRSTHRGSSKGSKSPVYIVGLVLGSIDILDSSRSSKLMGRARHTTSDCIVVLLSRRCYYWMLIYQLGQSLLD